MLQNALFLIATGAYPLCARGHFCHKTLDLVAFHHRGVVGVGHHGVLRAGLVRVADHAEQALVLRHAVDGELGVEDLVAAVLAVGLREHHQLHVGGVALEALEGVDEVVDFIVGQRQAPAGVGILQRGAATSQHVHMLHGLGRQLGEQGLRVGQIEQHGLGHAVVQQRGHLGQLLLRQRGAAQQAVLHLHAVFHGTFHTAHLQAAVARNVGGLGGPGRHRAQARRDDDGGAIQRALVGVAVGQQRGQALVLLGRGGCIRGHQVHEARRNGGNLRVDGFECGLELLGAKGAEGVAARNRGQVQGHFDGLGGW
jgi:hypothetical protein